MYGSEVWNRGMERILQGGMERGYGTGVWNGCGPGACSGPPILTCTHMLHFDHPPGLGWACDELATPPARSSMLHWHRPQQVQPCPCVEGWIR